MTTIIFLFLIFNIFSSSFQTIKAAFFCDDTLEEIYVVEGTTEIKIVDESNMQRDGGIESPYYFNELNAVPGDLIKFDCFNSVATTYGVGCFLLKDNCTCYDFNPNLPKDNDVVTHLETSLDGKPCKIDVNSLLDKIENKHYYYQHYIPLDASKISCEDK